MDAYGESRVSPTVSIGMPVYNGGKYLREAIESVLRQTFHDYELIISDNASEDDTGPICAEYGARSSRIRYVRQQQNIGSHRNFNFVTQQARGRFITWLAHDDVLEPEFLQRTVEYLLATPAAVVVASDFAVIDESGRQVGSESLATIRPEISWKKRAAEFFEYPGSNVCFCIYGLMRTGLCKAVFESLSEPRRASGSEFPVLARMAVSGEIAALPSVLRRYRKHTASVYMKEEAEIARASLLRRHAIRVVNVYRLRFDQVAVLWRSSLSFRFKCSTSLRVAVFYFSLLLSRLRKVLGIAVRSIRGRLRTAAGEGLPRG